VHLPGKSTVWRRRRHR